MLEMILLKAFLSEYADRLGEIFEKLNGQYEPPQVRVWKTPPTRALECVPTDRE